MTRWRKEGTLLATNSFETEHHCLYSIDSNQVLPATAARLNATHLHLHKSSRGHQVFSIVTTCASLGKASEKSEIYSPCKKNQMSEFRVPKTSLCVAIDTCSPFPEFSSLPLQDILHLQALWDVDWRREITFKLIHHCTDQCDQCFYSSTVRLSVNFPALCWYKL